ncbi:hypothetical protein [Actinoalloteichus fjordicus]|uniref:Uncharacterized protein n=1 Tax=Actinoalloteichus fjordicus TaxID=1612552 RepID=A0AAC9PU22_9PSEU|nr:hypothetical protein [Actinoalloteichus fjordicus]APU16625.1 hypothetical protein UA74_23035 [Actinoalloteichus fjordicus]
MHPGIYASGLLLLSGLALVRCARSQPDDASSPNSVAAILARCAAEELRRSQAVLPHSGGLPAVWIALPRTPIPTATHHPVTHDTGTRRVAATSQAAGQATVGREARGTTPGRRATTTARCRHRHPSPSAAPMYRPRPEPTGYVFAFAGSLPVAGFREAA